MMKQVNKWTAIGVVVAALGASTAVLARDDEDCERGWKHHGSGMHHKGGMMLQRMTGELDLSDDQKARIQEIMEESREEAKELRGDKRDMHREIMEAASSGASEKELRKMAREQADHHVDMIMHRTATMNKVRAVLTEEQQKEWDALRQERMERMEQRKDRPGR